MMKTMIYTPNETQTEYNLAGSLSGINEVQPQEDFIMHPTIDVCFAGLMDNPTVRKGFCAAVMRVKPEEIEETELLPTHLHREYADDKLGILDVRVRLKNGIQINMEMQVKKYPFWDERALFYLSKMFTEQLREGEVYGRLKKSIQVSILDFILFPDDARYYRTMHFRDDETGKLYNDKMELQILELKKLPGEIQAGEDIANWMRFFNGKNRKEFEDMARVDEYLDEAYEALKRLSADDEKRLEYEARAKVLRDHINMLEGIKEEGLEEGRKEGLEEGRKEGRKEGLEEGRKEGIQMVVRAVGLHVQGMTDEEIARQCNISKEEVKGILALYKI